MECLILATFLLLLFADTNAMPKESLNDNVEPRLHNIKKREVRASANSIKRFQDFVEEKLIQHAQALEHLVKLAEVNEDRTNKLVEHISKDIQPPKLPEKVELLSRRAFGSESPTADSPPNDTVNSNWCSEAVLCRKTMEPVCGYDQKFGYAKFEDICHVLRSNCYWKYNFSIVPNCNPFDLSVFFQ